MSVKMPGAMASSTMANVVLGNPNVKTEHSDMMHCAADVWMRDAELVPEWKAGCDFPSPVLYLVGNIVRIRGNMPHGVTTLVFKQDETVEDSDVSSIIKCPHCGTGLESIGNSCPKCQKPFSSQDKEAMRKYEMRQTRLAAEGVPDFPAVGPEVRFRFEFTPAEKAELVSRGLMEAGFTVPGILTGNEFKAMPVPCEFITVVPDTAEDVPFTFVRIPNQLCINTCTKECGYELIQYFEKSHVMQTQANIVPPVEDEMSVSMDETKSKSYDDELLDMFDSAKIDDDIFELAAKRDELAREGLGLAEDEEGKTDEQSGADISAEDEAKAIADEAADQAQAEFDRKHEGDIIKNMLQGFTRGVPVTDIARDSIDDAEDERQAQRNRRQRARLEAEQEAAEQAQREAAKEAAKAAERTL